jgi:hypothetical protein
MNKMILTGAGIVGAGIGIKGQIDAKEFDPQASTDKKAILSNGAITAATYVGYAAGATKLIESAITKKPPNLAMMGFGAGIGALEGFIGQKQAQLYDKNADDSIGAYAKNMLRGSVNGALIGVGVSGIASDLVFHK